jgi:hypothetical protein
MRELHRIVLRRIADGGALSVDLRTLDDLATSIPVDRDELQRVLAELEGDGLVVREEVGPRDPLVNTRPTVVRPTLEGHGALGSDLTP